MDASLASLTSRFKLTRNPFGSLVNTISRRRGSSALPQKNGKENKVSKHAKVLWEAFLYFEYVE